jgi:hypothetical protein
VCSKVVLESSDDTSDNEVTRCHANSTCNQNALSSELVDPKNGWNREDKLHNTYNTGCEKVDGVASQSNTFEYEWPIF